MHQVHQILILLWSGLAACRDHHSELVAIDSRRRLSLDITSLFGATCGGPSPGSLDAGIHAAKIERLLFGGTSLHRHVIDDNLVADRRRGM